MHRLAPIRQFSGLSGRARRAAGAVALVLSAMGAASASADSVRGIRPGQAEPLAPRGGVLLLPLDAERHGHSWPSSISITLADQREIDGLVVWQHLAAPDRQPLWTDPPVPLAVRAIEPGDDSSGGAGAPFLAVQLPIDGEGPITLLDRAFVPRWVDVPTNPFGDEPRGDGGAGSLDAPLELVSAADRPDPASPFEYWRWVMLASRLGRSPPAPAGDAASQLVARYHADLWAIALGRVASRDPDAARRCRDLLTATCFDQTRVFAAWITEPAELRALLAGALDLSMSDDLVARHAREWADARETLFAWFEGEENGRVVLSIVNAGAKARLVRFRWVFADAARSAAEVPVAVEVAAGRQQRIPIDRPRPTDAEREAGAMAEAFLHVESDTFERQYEIRSGRVEASPPGVPFTPFFAPLTLADARAERYRAPAPPRSTNAVLRRVNGRWEAFLECFRPPGGSSSATPFTMMREPHETRGVEAVTLFIGPTDRPNVVVTVPEEGDHHLWTGRFDASLEVHRRSLGDRWFCRIVLPDSWLDYPISDSALIGFMRTHGGDDAIETSPNAAIPWRLQPGRVEVGMRAWTDLPR
jgi:hypothetical protein